MIIQLLLSVFVLLVAGFGLAMIVGQHRAYVNWLRRMGLAILRRIWGFFRWAWANYWRYILTFIAGALTALYFTGHLS